MTELQLNKREEDIQKLIIGGVKNFLIIEILVPFRRKELHQTNEKIHMGKKIRRRSLQIQCPKTI
jgi:hypothetical protein